MIEDATYYAIVGIVAGLVYINSLHGEFVFDDLPAIRDNQDVNPSKTHWTHVFEDNFWGQPQGSQWSAHVSYRPLTTLTFRANYIIHGFEPFGYHAVNLVLHVIASILVMAVAKRVFQHFPAQITVSSFACGLLFAVHPVHAEAVANIVCRAELLSGIFWCLAFVAYDTACKQSKIGGSVLWITGTTLSALTALMCKEQGIMVLPCCIVYDILVVDRLDLAVLLSSDEQTAGDKGKTDGDKSEPKEKVSTATPKKKGKPGKIVKVKGSKAKEDWPAWLPSVDCLIRVALMLVITFSMYQWRVSLNKGDDVKNDEKTNPANHIDDFILRVLTKNYYVFLHFWLLVVPWDLCCDWSSFGIANIDTVTDYRNLSTLSMYSFLIISGLSLALTRVCARSYRSAILTGLAIMAVNFVPASGLLVETGFVVAERILYLPSIGYCIAVTAAVGALLQACNPAARRMLLSLGVVVLLLFAGRTLMRNADWSGERSLYKTGLDVQPYNAKLHHNYGRLVEGREAEYHFRMAIRQYKYYGSAYINLGVILANSDRLDEAIQIWKDGLAAWRTRPILGQDPVILNVNIGTGLKNSGKLEEAIPYFKQCLKLSPGRSNCDNSLREISQRLGRSV
eukprot:TRINITY_DN6961_c0_g1_i3.p1 TRINITY_DN6961_c0_g1~~TRINITY_DN6961_c0_g1_i3.p1  ORF type:complete len:622 (+),score=148.13 TRINITY_DN6961_c0_g1_i3:62-1927(+)